jgi:hypothetical protein
VPAYITDTANSIIPIRCCRKSQNRGSDPGVGIDVGVLDLGVAEAPAAARRAALELARRPELARRLCAVSRRGELLRARTGS